MSAPIADRPHLVIGTAGHIDHGKSALVHALTGIDPDRLDEEKRRGITIDLGFADLDLGECGALSFVDVPGHERFVRHMVAGATGIDAVLLVVAADQGVQPQTTEHLDICSLLGIGRGVVALTKCDLVDDELREVAALEVRELLQDSFLASAPVVPVSARSGAGIDELKAELGALFAQGPPRPADGIVRLPIDRSFVLRGFGTVVTGTLVSGTLAEGDEIEILPGGLRGRVRGLQVHGRRAASVAAGRRTAVNLQGLDRIEAPRGATVTRPGTMTTTRRVWAVARLLPSAPRELEGGGRVRFHVSTLERGARMRVLARDPDGSLRVELRLDGDAVLAPGDRFILRRPSPVNTIGGGTVVESAPPRRAREREIGAIDLTRIDAVAALRLRLRRAGVCGRRPGDLALELGRSAEEMDRAYARLEEAGEVFRARGLWVDARSWQAARERTLEELDRFHDRETLRSGMSREALRARVGPELPHEAWRELLTSLEAEGALRLEGERVAKAGHSVVLEGAERALADRIDGRFASAGLDPPSLEDVVERADSERAKAVASLLVESGRLVRIQDGRLFHAEALSDLRARLRRHAAGSRTIDVAGFKALTGISRRNAIPLLEHLDAERSTKRVGNLREILLPPDS